MHRNMVGNVGAIETLLTCLRRHTNISLARRADGTTTCVATAKKGRGGGGGDSGGGDEASSGNATGNSSVGSVASSTEKLLTTLWSLCIGSPTNKERAVEAHALPTLLHLLHSKLEKSSGMYQGGSKSLSGGRLNKPAGLESLP